MRRFVLMLALLLSSFAAIADDKEELQGLYSAVNALNQEQQAIFQQFKMLQELRRSNDRALSAAQLPQQYASGVPNYSDVVQNQTDTARHGEDLAQEADQLYARYGEIAARKSLLQQRILELTLPR